MSSRKVRPAKPLGRSYTTPVTLRWDRTIPPSVYQRIAVLPGFGSRRVDLEIRRRWIGEIMIGRYFWALLIFVRLESFTNTGSRLAVLLSIRRSRTGRKNFLGSANFTSKRREQTATTWSFTRC